MLTEKQKEYIRESDGHRWGLKTGAVRSGKTYLDIIHTIPANIRARQGLPGLCVILGNTKGTLQRNIITPLQEQFGTRFVSDIRSDNTARLFGETCYCLGADNIRHVDRIRGSSIKYCYCDEAATYNQAVFEMLKSRLDKDYSRCDATSNPDAPAHWYKKFIDSDIDAFRQTYTIDDNPTLPPSFVDALKREYAGTVYYDRLILGLWVAAQGAIYRSFADNPGAHIITAPPAIYDAIIGVDFGGHGSAHAFSLVGFTPRYDSMVVLDEWYHLGEVTPQELEQALIAFIRQNVRKYPITEIRADSAETTLIRGLDSAVAAAGIAIPVYKCLKKPINDRINCEVRLFTANRFFIMEHCAHHIEAFNSAVWDERHITEDVRLDNGTVPSFDMLDACEYAFEGNISNLIERGFNYDDRATRQGFRGVQYSMPALL